jgi:cell division protein FtsN
MAKEKKNSPDGSVPQKVAAKSSPVKKVAAKKPAAKKPAEMAAAAVSASAPPAQPLPAELHEEIRLRAYEFYCERGGHHGLHDADWQRAELEVRAKYGT